MSKCSICLDDCNYAKTTLKCGHEYCSECLLNFMAKNTGASRRNCPECRNPFCDEVEPSNALSIRLDDLEEERDDLDTAFNEIYQEKERLNSYIDRLFERLREAENRRDASCTPEETRSADVVVPAGLRPGGAFNIDTGGGKLMRVVVPAGVSGGQTIRVQCPAPRSSTPLFDISGINPRELFPDTREYPDRHSLDRRGGLLRFDEDATLPDIWMELPLDIDEGVDTCEDCQNAADNLQAVEHLVAQDVCMWIDGLSRARRSEIGVFCALRYTGGIEGITPECVEHLTGKMTGEILSKYGRVKKYRRENVAMQKERLLSILEFRDEWVETTNECEWILRRGWVVEKMENLNERFNAARFRQQLRGDVPDGL